MNKRHLKLMLKTVTELKNEKRQEKDDMLYHVFLGQELILEELLRK